MTRCSHFNPFFFAPLGVISGNNPKITPNWGLFLELPKKFSATARDPEGSRAVGFFFRFFYPDTSFALFFALPPFLSDTPPRSTLIPPFIKREPSPHFVSCPIFYLIPSLRLIFYPDIPPPFASFFTSIPPPVVNPRNCARPRGVTRGWFFFCEIFHPKII